MTEGAPGEARRADLRLALALMAVHPAALGGLVLRSSATPERDTALQALQGALPASEPCLRLPLSITEDRLLGGLALAATLAAGRVVVDHGVLAMADGGVLIVASGERLEPQVTAQLCAALDHGEIGLEREGLSARLSCRVGLLVLDEGVEDERIPAKLADRLAFHVDLHGLRLPAQELAGALQCDAAAVLRARARLGDVYFDPSLVGVLCEAAEALGVTSLRAPLLAVAAARAHAAWSGRAQVEEADLVAAARMVLGPRATRVPASPEAADEEPGCSAPEPPAGDEAEGATAPPEPREGGEGSGEELGEIVLEAAKSGLPKGLLDGLTLERAPRTAPRTAGQAGVLRASAERGRKVGTRAAAPRSNERLNVLETLRAAAPWQTIRRRERGAGGTSRRIEVRGGDFRVNRHAQRTETSVIFAVDASGSAALQRLAEAKGAVELVLADCYARRDHVALLSFRGAGAALLLPFTRALARARRCLAELAGGGGTPLAAGIDAALALALESRKRGRTPLIVLMTDGRANVGKGDALADAIASAGAVRLAGVRSLLLDTSPRPRAETRALSVEMGARYVPLPYADANTISGHVTALARGA
jgi:magnesium chelatase subunit D